MPATRNPDVSFCQLIHTYITRAIAKWYETRSHLSGTGSHTYLPDSVFSETVIPPEPPLRSLLHFGSRNVGKFKAEMFLLIKRFQYKSENKGCYSEACKHHERRRIIVADRSLIGGEGAVGKSFHNLRIGLVKNLTYKHREEPEADVLDPEYQGVGGTDDFRIDEFPERWATTTREQARTTRREQKDCHVSQDNSAYGIPL